VTSPTSAIWDRDGKFALYRTLPSLQHYVVVAHEAWQVDHFRRLPDGSWRMTSHGPGESLDLDALGITLAVNDLYAKVEAFGGPTPNARPRPVSYPGPNPSRVVSPDNVQAPAPRQGCARDGAAPTRGRQCSRGRALREGGASPLPSQKPTCPARAPAFSTVPGPPG
jgi:hypothetical protein